MKPTESQINLVNFIKGAFNLFINPDGKISFSRLFLGLLFAFILMIYQHKDVIQVQIENITSNNSYDTYLKEKEDERIENLNASIKNQAQSIYAVIKPDMVGVYIYTPEDLHHFKVLQHYEGKLPEHTSQDKFQRIGVDKISKEYSAHILGMPYQSDGVETCLADPEVNHYTYSCPIFNRRSVYVGTVSLNWRDVPNKIDEKQYYVACTSAARNIGIYK